MFTNVNNHGGNVEAVLNSKFRSAADLQIASGYVSYDVLDQYQQHFNRVAINGGRARLLLGMAFYDGLSNNSLTLAKNISQNLNQFQNGSGVFVSYSRRYHGKVFSFYDGTDHEYLVGSSNFSRSGLTDNIECTVSVDDTNTKQQLSNFLDFLFDANNSVSILNAKIIVRGSTHYTHTISTPLLQNLQRYNPATINQAQFPLLEISLSRIVRYTKSNLNTYFGKGRLNTRTGIVTPRPWYEVEIIADADARSNPIYPQGNFTAYTDDGYVMPMRTSGDYYKNIRSKDGLQILGMWIKGKLQQSGSLQPLTPVMQGTLDIYGNDTLRLYQINPAEYYMEF